MKRREFMAALGSVAAAPTAFWPRAARAQQDERVRALQIRIMRMQAEAAAAQIGQFIREIVSQVGWTTQLPWSTGTIDQRRFDGLRLLRQTPAITELAQFDSSGKEQLRVSRLAMDVVASHGDFSSDPKFTEAVAKKVYYGPVYFREAGQVNSRVMYPYVTVSVGGTRRDAGVSVAEVNLMMLSDLVRALKVGERGVVYVVDAQNRVIAHPDSSLLQRDVSGLAQVQAARTGTGAAREAAQAAKDIHSRDVLAASVEVAPPLGWLVIVELPAEEANAPAR